MKKLMLLIALFCSTLSYAQSPSNIGLMYDDKPYIPHEMEGYFDLDEAMAAAKEQNKPLFIDVTSHTCNNCREMETRVWYDNRVLNLLENEYIICALFVDDKMALDPADYYTSAEGKVMTELGRKNFAIAKERWNVTSQPGYVLVTPDGKAMLMPEPLGFETDINKFVDYLETGLENFQNGTTYAAERPGKVKDTVDENFQSGTTYAAERPGKVKDTVDENFQSGTTYAAERPGKVKNPNTDKKYGDKLEIPHEMEGYFDLDEAMAAAKEQNKPLFIDVTGHACNNCREMETRVWSDNRVMNLLENKYIICALYVDDKMALDPADYYTSAEGKVMTELGRKNFAIAKERWNVTSQPGYVLVTPDGEAMLMPEPLGFETDINKFVDYLETGLENFQNGTTYAAERPGKVKDTVDENFQSGTTYAAERPGKVKDTVDENFQSGTTYAAERPGKVWGTVEEFNDDTQAQWELTAEEVEYGIYELRFTSTIKPGFHGYPLTDMISGPLFTWEDDSILVGEMTEPLASTLHNGEYEGKAEYAQRVKGNNGDVVKVNVLSTFCKGNMCTSSDCDFTVTLN